LFGCPVAAPRGKLIRTEAGRDRLRRKLRQIELDQPEAVVAVVLGVAGLNLDKQQAVGTLGGDVVALHHEIAAGALRVVEDRPRRRRGADQCKQ
jgi:hypothetical protein